VVSRKKEINKWQLVKTHGLHMAINDWYDLIYNGDLAIKGM
jgi:hypothetical protein